MNNEELLVKDNKEMNIQFYFILTLIYFNFNLNLI